ncbi:MAG TPA: proline-rich domain-containing protein [Lysobacter sp.]
MNPKEQLVQTWQARIGALMVAAAAALGFGGTASAQDYTFGWNPRSGDVWVDTWLSDMNRYGSRYRDPFVDEMVRYHGAPRELVTDLLVTRHWAPGDVYFACALAAVIGRPCRYVADIWERDHAQGWGNVAKNLGIKPGSAEFHRLKKGFVPSYDRWGRAITLDTELERDFPGRGKGAAASGKHKPGKAPASAGKGKAAAPAKGHGKPAASPAKGGGKPAASPPKGGKPASPPGKEQGNKGNGKG